MARYDDITTRSLEDITYRGTTVYPEAAPSEEDYYVISSTGDRFDVLAKEFYGNQTYWWVIASANPTVRKDTMWIEPGIQLRIPPLSTILRSYEQLNRTR